MKALDWVGLVLIGGVVIGGGAFYFVKMRPLSPQQQAGVGAPVSVVPQGSVFVQAVPHSNTSQGVNDATAVIGAVGGLAHSLFPNGIGGLF